MFSLLSDFCCRCWSLVVGVVVLSLSLYCPRWRRCPSSWLLPSALALHQRYCFRNFVVVIGEVLYPATAASLFFTDMVGFSASVSLLAAASCCRCYCLLIFGGVSLSLLPSAYCCRCRRLVIVAASSLFKAASLLVADSVEFYSL